MTRLRVALVIGRLNVGGAEAELVRLARRLDRERFDPVVVTLLDRGPLADRLDGIELVELGRRRKWAWGTVAALRAALERIRPDVVQSFLFTENVFCRRIGIGAVVSGLQGSLSEDVETGPSLRMAFERATWKRAAAVVSNSRHYRDLYGRLGLDVSKVRVVPSAVEPSPSSDGAVVRREFGLRDGEVLVTCVARLVERKGHEDLIRACPGYRLLFAGDGPFRPRLEGRGAILAGTRRDVPAVLAASDVVALASRFGEGCPNAVLEAMSAGKPVVATRGGGTGEVVVDGETGFLVDPGDVEGLRRSISRLAADPALRARMGEAGRALVADRHGVDAFTKAYEELYFDLTRNRASV